MKYFTVKSTGLIVGVNEDSKTLEQYEKYTELYIPYIAKDNNKDDKKDNKKDK